MGVHFEDFILQLDASSRGGFRARVIKSPFGEGAASFSLPAAAVAGPSAAVVRGTARALEHQAAAPADGGRPPLEIGTELFRTVFQGQVRTLLDKSRGKLEMSPDLGLRLKIKLDLGDADAGALADLPWELLCDGETEDFFALSRQTSLVRYLDVPRPSQPIPFTPPLRILAVGASPRGLAALDLAQEVRRLEQLHSPASGVAVQFLANASTAAVREALARDTFHVLHFMGHGVFDGASGEGMLAFEGADHRLDRVSGKAFATKIKDVRSLGVIVLNACETARAGHQEGLAPFRGVASALVLGGVPAVVAMQRPISDRAAISFSDAFYRHLSRGDSIDEALTEGRQAIHSAESDGFEWATPVLFLRIPEGNVFVAKSPESPCETPPPVPTLVASPAAQPAPQPAAAPASTRGGRMRKLAVGVAGAGLLAAGTGYLYVMPRRSQTPPATYTLVPRAGEQAGPDGGKSSERQASPGRPTRLGAPKDIHGANGPGRTAKAGARQDASRGATYPVNGSQSGEQPARSQAGQEAPLQQPSRRPTGAVPPADISNLSAQMIGITRGDRGRLHVKVSFHNGGGLPLAVLLNPENVVLSDDQGRRYDVQLTDLPAAGSHRRLDLQAGASKTAYFDFPMPKLGSTSFSIELATADGQQLQVSGAPLTLGVVLPESTPP
jgi:CHAT domain